MAPMILHAFAGSPNPNKIAIALELLQLDYTVQIWQFGTDPVMGVKSAAFAPLSPNGRVPVLEDPATGVKIWESGAIMNYLKRRYDPEGKLLSLGPGRGSGKDGEVTEQDVADIEAWELLLLTTVGPMSGQLVWFSVYNQQQNQDAVDRYKAQVYRCYGILEDQLKKSDGASIIPGGVTSADLHWIPWTSNPEFLGLSTEKYPLMKKWIRGMVEMTEFKAAYGKVREAATAAGTVNTDASGKLGGPDQSLMKAAREGQ